MLGPTTTKTLFTALIRTHHITNRKKLSRAKKAAMQLALPFVLVRSGGSPGIMYAEGTQQDVTDWVGFVRSLHYKDFACVRKPAATQVFVPAREALAGFHEVESMLDFSRHMEQRGLQWWWKPAIGYR